mgnify:FL=1
MKKPSGTRVNIMIMGIVIVVLALGLAAILGYGKARKQMEQMQQAQQEQEAKEAQEKAMVEGMENGRLSEKYAIAKNLKESGVSKSLIAQYRKRI